MKLLVQGDDFGFTRGVTYGIIDFIDHGILEIQDCLLICLRQH